MVRNGTKLVLIETAPKDGLRVSCPACGDVANFEVADLDDTPMSRGELELLAQLMDGTSPAYAVPPGPESMIGCCEKCGTRGIKIDIFTLGYGRGL